MTSVVTISVRFWYFLLISSAILHDIDYNCAYGYLIVLRIRFALKFHYKKGEKKFTDIKEISFFIFSIYK